MKIKVDDISDNLHCLLEIVGEDAFVEISKLYGGDILYVPTYKSICRASRNRDIVKRFNGINTAMLAKEYGISCNHVKRIVAESSL